MTGLDRLILERLRQHHDQSRMVRADLDRRIESLLGALDRPWLHGPVLASGPRFSKELRHD